MHKKKILSFLLSLSLIAGCIPSNFVFAETNKRERAVYLHAQGAKPTATVDDSTVYTGETADIYFAIDNPNMGAYENGVHTEPQYDLNGYTVTIYFDPQYFDYASNGAPIDYTVPDTAMNESQTGSEEIGSGTVTDVPSSTGYYVRTNKRGTAEFNGKTYKSATITVFFSGGYIPQKTDSMLWYNLCKLPLTVKNNKGSTQVFFDTSGNDGTTLELFAKNKSSDPNDQTFTYNPISGGYHTINVKDRTKPSAPVANPPAGSYTDVQNVVLTAEEGCDIYYSLNGGTMQPYTGSIKVETTTVITAYAERISDGKQSSSVSFEYKILPKAPFLFIDNNGTKELINNIYNSNTKFKVYATDKDTFGTIDADNEIYYTFSNISEENPTAGKDPEKEWVKLDAITREIEITKKTTVRLITKKENALTKEFSEVSEYRLGIEPSAPTARPDSGKYETATDVALNSLTEDARIYYTLDGTDPITNGILYDGIITIAKDTTLRAVSEYDGIYSEISSYWYIIKSVDDFGVDAFYPSGVYEGSVNVTLTANNPENGIKYSIDDGNTWRDYTEMLKIDTDTNILAKAGKDGNWGGVYTFTYKIKPRPPAFSPETTQFTNSSKVSVYCEEIDKDNTERFSLFYTLDGTDPITSVETRLQADPIMDSVEIDITKYTVVKAVVLKDGKTYSTVVTHSYDIVNKKPTKPLVTLPVGNYTRKIDDDKGFETKFVPVLSGTDIYYTVSYDDTFTADPEPNTTGTKYDKTPIEVKGHTIIKAVAVNVFGIKSDVGIFEYKVTPEAPIAAPSATIHAAALPVVPVSAVKGSTVKYEINGLNAEFKCESGSFYIDTADGKAYGDKDRTIPLQAAYTGVYTPSDKTAKLEIRAELDRVESSTNTYIYTLSDNEGTLAQPYADKATGEYEEIAIEGDADYNLLYIKLYSLNTGDTIRYRINNSGAWIDYTGDAIKIKNDTVLQIRSEKDGNYSLTASYVYTFVPLAPIIELESGLYILSDAPKTEIFYDSRAPQDKIQDGVYSIFYRKNGDTQDWPYTLGFKPDIGHTMSFKAYVKNSETGRVSKNTIHYYIIENENAAYGSVYVANPYDVIRINASLLGTGEYAKGIKLLTQKRNAKINYFYSYTMKDSSDSVTTNNSIYDNIPITVNPQMTGIKITAWLEDDNGKVDGSDFSHEIEFVHLEVPKTSLGSEKVEFANNTKYTLINDYPTDSNIFLYYTLDGSDLTLETNENRKIYAGEELTLTGAVTVKAVYMSACGKCVNCKDDNKTACINMVYGDVGEYKYTTPTIQYTGGSSGGGGTRVIDNTRAYTKDIFGNEQPTHISYISGYPDGSVQPDGNITREETASILYRITNHEYEKPSVATGGIFPDVEAERWSAHDIEYMAEKEVVSGYPDGEFKPINKLTRAEFATLICRFVKLEEAEAENSFSDLEESHWAYEYILSLAESGLVEGYEDGTFKPENEITRAEVMTVINKILGRNPSDAYVKSLDFTPYTDLAKDKWYYTVVMEATVTHDYWLDKNGVEEKWENWK